MSSAICFNLDQPKILSHGNGIILVHCTSSQDLSFCEVFMFIPQKVFELCSNIILKYKLEALERQYRSTGLIFLLDEEKILTSI